MEAALSTVPSLFQSLCSCDTEQLRETVKMRTPELIPGSRSRMCEPPESESIVSGVIKQR